MNLKEKAKEAKQYGEIKDELIKLTNEFLARYKEYESVYKNIYREWINKTIEDFKSIFESEGFDVSTKALNYSNIDNNYKTIKATLYDLEFELLFSGECNNMRFLQVKPEVEEKNIVLRPAIKKYYINRNYIEINGTQKVYNDGSRRVSTIYKLEEKMEKVKEAQFSIEEMKEFIFEVKEEINLLLDELKKIKGKQVNGVATPSGKYGDEDMEHSYGEFKNLSELIEKI
ncbi:TPA: hypothetical protein PTW06_000911 [Clostridium botulinum]|nr:hypothetical protein [Clostridium botulinum]HDK7223607.1 hypothetical protein [Clostridium botulinum]HDK7271061.1 hypothetical protein [Clostridium botulinum]HDK7304417.1 hypothetical protein [Clostridium botulinum]